MERSGVESHPTFWMESDPTFFLESDPVPRAGRSKSVPGRGGDASRCAPWP